MAGAAWTGAFGAQKAIVLIVGGATLAFSFVSRNERGLFVQNGPETALAALAATPNPQYPFFYGLAPNGPGRPGVLRSPAFPFRQFLAPGGAVVPLANFAESTLPLDGVQLADLPSGLIPSAFTPGGADFGGGPGGDALPPVGGGVPNGNSPGAPTGGNPGPEPVATPTPTPSVTPTPSPSGTPTPTPSATPTPEPSATPTSAPSPQPSPTPTTTPPGGEPTPTPTPVPAVPEPGTWLMMICGMAVVGGMLRRRRMMHRRGRAPAWDGSFRT